MAISERLRDLKQEEDFYKEKQKKNNCVLNELGKDLEKKRGEFYRDLAWCDMEDTESLRK